MTDLAHVWGGDLSLSPTGDLAVIDGLEKGRQRVLRRLMTGSPEYIWEPPYGAGIPAYIGSIVDAAEARALILAQMALEPTVLQNPPPQVTVTQIPNGLSANITYTDSGTGTTATLAFDLTQ